MKLSYMILSFLFGNTCANFFSAEPEAIKEVEDNIDSAINSAHQFLNKFKGEYIKLNNLEEVISVKTTTLADMLHEIENKEIERKTLADYNKRLKDENNELDRNNSIFEKELDTKKTKIVELSKEIETKTSLNEQILSNIEVQKKTEAELNKVKLILDIDIVAKTLYLDETKKSVEIVKTEENNLGENIKRLQEEHADLRTKNSILDYEKIEREKQISKMNDQIQDKNKMKEIIEIKIQTAKSYNLVLRNENSELQKEKCKEYYTLWDKEFLSNNKKSVFTSILATVLISASLSILFKVSKTSSTSSVYNSPQSKSIQEKSHSRLEHLSDDEDSNDMMASSSALLNRDVKYNYARDAMEKNEEPNRCFDYIRKKYGVEENIKSHWEDLKHGENIQFNLWKVHNGELTFTKVMLKKTLKGAKHLLTFELYQTQQKESFSHSDCEETELVEDDNSFEAKLAMKMFHSLPTFSL